MMREFWAAVASLVKHLRLLLRKPCANDALGQDATLIFPLIESESCPEEYGKTSSINSYFQCSWIYGLIVFKPILIMRQKHLVGLLWGDEWYDPWWEGLVLWGELRDPCGVTCDEECVTQVGRSGKPPPHFLLKPRTTCCCHFLKSQDSSAGCGSWDLTGRQQKCFYMQSSRVHGINSPKKFFAIVLQNH